MRKLEQVVLVNEVLGNYGELDADVLLAIKGGSQVEVPKIGRKKPSSWSRADTIDHEFDEFEGACFCTTVTRVSNGVAADSDACSFLFLFHWP